MIKRMDAENKREKYIKARVNDNEMKDFARACDMLDLNKSDLIRLAVIEFLAKENITIWK